MRQALGVELDIQVQNIEQLFRGSQGVPGNELTHCRVRIFCPGPSQGVAANLAQPVGRPVAPPDVKPVHIDHRNPAADFDLVDAGVDEVWRDRRLTVEELQQIALAMRTTPNYRRENEPAVWLLLALCVRKMELLSARWDAFDLDAGIWTLAKENTKTRASIRIPLAEPVIAWLKEARVFSFGKPYVFPARRLVRSRLGVNCRNRYEHVGPDTLNVALKRLKVLDIEHFTVHDMRRTARTHLAVLGVDRFVAERSLNHKLGTVEGIYDRHDYFAERAAALGAWASLLAKVESGKVLASPTKARRAPAKKARRVSVVASG